MRRSLPLRTCLLLLFCVAASMLGGCGQKGPLYLPRATKPAPASSTVKPAPMPPPDANRLIPDNERPASAQS